MMCRLFFYLFMCLYTSVNAQLIISEVMFDPATSEYHDEFVEVFNLSYQDSFDTSGLSFSDSSGTDKIFSHTRGGKIAPRAFGVILDGSYFENSTTYDRIIPDSAVILRIGDNSFGSAGLSNSYPEYLTLIDSKDSIISAYRYTIDNEPGYSDELIRPDSESVAANWGNSQISGGTPGFINSISPRGYDAGFRSGMIQLPRETFYGDDIRIELVMANFGTAAIYDSLDLEIYLDMDRDSLRSGSDPLLYTGKIVLSGGMEDHPFFVVLSDIQPGQYLLVARVDYLADENTANNIATAELHIRQRKGSVRLNEIKFLTVDDEPEWVELINTGRDPAYLSGWGICDAADTALIDSGVYLGPGGIKVLSSSRLDQSFGVDDSLVIILKGFPNLNNNGDEVRLLRPDGSWQEFVRYQEDWLEGESFKNPSLERINPELYAGHSSNWGPCVDGLRSTPGRENSIYSDLQRRDLAINIAPSPFSPDMDGIDDAAVISGYIPEYSGRLRILVFDIRGRIIRRLAEYHFSGSQYSFVWDGKDDQGRIARIGIYIVFVQFIDDRNGVLSETKASVVLAGQL